MLIALDSNVLIAALSPHEAHSAVAQKLAGQIVQGLHQAVVSSIVCGEVLVLYSPGANDAQPLDLTIFLDSLVNLATVPADDTICLAAGKLREKWGRQLKLPDAIHLATALSQKVELFITNDVPLAKIARQILATKTLGDF